MPAAGQTLFAGPADRGDYLQRICAAWDFGIVPEPRTFEMLSDWRAVFDAYPLPHSPAYHAFRSSCNWPPIPGLCLEADYEKHDAARGRQDPCAHLV